MKNLLNLEPSFSKIYTSWKKNNKTLINSTEKFWNGSKFFKNFSSSQSFFIVWNQKHMIFVLGEAGSRGRKLLKLDTILERVPGQKPLKFTIKKKQKNSLLTWNLTTIRQWYVQVCHLNFGSSRENKLSSQDILQNCVTCTPWKSQLQ